MDISPSIVSSNTHFPLIQSISMESCPRWLLGNGEIYPPYFMFLRTNSSRFTHFDEDLSLMIFD